MIFLLHGFNVSDNGDGSIDRLKPYIDGETYDFDYGWKGLVGVMRWNRKLAQALASLTRPGDVGIGHSNGCAILHLSTLVGAQFSKLIYINPALDKDAAPGPAVERLDVWHSPSDIPVRISSYLWGHEWGKMGAVGYTGDDPRVTNFDKENDFALSSCGHSDVFETGMINYFGPLIVSGINE